MGARSKASKGPNDRKAWGLTPSSRAHARAHARGPGRAHAHPARQRWVPQRGSTHGKPRTWQPSHGAARAAPRGVTSGVHDCRQGRQRAQATQGGGSGAGAVGPQPMVQPPRRGRLRCRGVVSYQCGGVPATWAVHPWSWIQVRLPPLCSHRPRLQCDLSSPRSRQGAQHARAE